MDSLSLSCPSYFHITTFAQSSLHCHISALYLPLQVTREGKEIELIARGRHDPCVVPRAVPMVEAMVALVLADHLLQVIRTPLSVTGPLYLPFV